MSREDVLALIAEQALVERLRVLVWQTPENVQIFYKPQDYDLFEMVRLREADNGDAATRSD